MNIVAERLDRGMSPTEAAAEIGVARGTLARAETGLPVQPSKAKLIADYYGCKVTDLYPVPEERAA